MQGWAYENDEPKRDSGGRPAYKNDAQPCQREWGWNGSSYEYLLACQLTH